MKLIKCIMFVMAALVLCLGLSACDGKVALQNVVAKTYNMTVQVEKYVTATDSTNLLNKVKMLEAPLKVTSSSLKFLADKVSDTGVKSSLLNVTQSVDTVIVLVVTASPAQVDELKAQILDGVGKTKQALVVAAQYLDIDLSTVTAKSGVTIDEILASSQELDVFAKGIEVREG